MPDYDPEKVSGKLSSGGLRPRTDIGYRIGKKNGVAKIARSNTEMPKPVKTIGYEKAVEDYRNRLNDEQKEVFDTVFEGGLTNVRQDLLTYRSEYNSELRLKAVNRSYDPSLLKDVMRRVTRYRVIIGECISHLGICQDAVNLSKNKSNQPFRRRLKNLERIAENLYNDIKSASNGN